MKKPSERLEELKKACEVRYTYVTTDERTIATLLNMMDKVGEILDELSDKLKE